MPFQHRILPQHRLAVIKATGTVTGQEVIDAHEATFLDPDWQPGFAVLWDARQSEQLVMEPEELPAFAGIVEKLKSEIGPARAAVVIPQREDHFLARMLTLRSTSILGNEQKVFYSLVSAAAWLDVPIDVLEAGADEARRDQ